MVKKHEEDDGVDGKESRRGVDVSSSGWYVWMVDSGGFARMVSIQGAWWSTMTTMMMLLLKEHGRWMMMVMIVVVVFLFIF